MSIELIVHAVILAVAFLSVAYLVFATAQKSEGLLKPVGVVLAAALAAIGVLVLVAHLTAPMFGGRPFGLPMHEGAATPSSSAAPSGASAPAEGAKPAAAASADAQPSESATKP
jgi:formate-dependent nitrite reductase membrane component NrfD